MWNVIARRIGLWLRSALAAPTSPRHASPARPARVTHYGPKRPTKGKPINLKPTRRE